MAEIELRNGLYTIELDIAHDCELGYIAEFMEEYELTMEIVQARGPAGGNPLIRFSSWKPGNLKKFKAEVVDQW